MSIRSIVFDFGETLVRNIRTDFDSANRRMLSLSGIDHLFEDFGTVQSETMYLFEQRESGELEVDFYKYFRLCLAAIGAELPFSRDQFEPEFWDAAFTFEPFEEIELVLRSIREERGLRFGVLSNSGFSAAPITRELHQHGIDDLFEFVISSQEFGVRKPAPALFQVALKKLGIEAEQVLFIGDRPGADIKGGRAVGMHTALFDPGDKHPKYYGTRFSRYSDLVGVLELVDKEDSH